MLIITERAGKGDSSLRKSQDIQCASGCMLPEAEERHTGSMERNQLAAFNLKIKIYMITKFIRQLTAYV